MEIHWKDWPLGSDATHERYELGALTETHAARADGSYLWIASVDYDRWCSEDTLVSTEYGFASREAAKAAAVSMLVAAIAAMQLTDDDVIALARRTVGRRGVREAVNRAGIGELAVEWWSRGDRLPTGARRARAVIAMRSIAAAVAA